MADLMEIRRRILTVSDPDLPPEYKRVDYIRAKSSAFIATNYIPVQYDEIESEFAIKANTVGLRCLFSAGTGSYQLVLLTQSGKDNTTYLRYFDVNAPAHVFNLENDKWYSMRLSANGVLTMNGIQESYTYKSKIDGTDNNLYIFKRRNGSSVFFGKLRSFRITNNGTLKLNMIACIRGSDGKAGMYDTISHIFYGSSGEEEFTPSTLDV